MNLRQHRLKINNIQKWSLFISQHPPLALFPSCQKEEPRRRTTVYWYCCFVEREITLKESLCAIDVRRTRFVWFLFDSVGDFYCLWSRKNHNFRKLIIVFNSTFCVDNKIIELWGNHCNWLNSLVIYLRRRYLCYVERESMSDNCQRALFSLRGWSLTLTVYCNPNPNE